MQEQQNFFSEIITGLVASLVGGFSTWFYNRARQAKEVDALEVDLVERAVKIWREMSEDLKKQVDELRDEVRTLRLERGGLEQKVNLLTKENGALKKQVNSFIKKYGSEH